MACSITPNGGYIVPAGTPVTLTASCTTPATSYAWTTAARSPQGCPAPTPANAAVAQVQSASPMTCWYDVVAGDGAGNQGTTRLGILWTNGTAPSGCSISTSPSPPSVPSGGGNISMAVSCTTGSPFTSFTWHKNSANFGGNQANQTDTLPPNTAVTPVNYIYDVQVCNAAGCAAPISTMFTVAGQTVATGFCGQYASAGVEQVDLPWPPTPDTIYTQNPDGFMGDGVFVGRLVVPANATSITAAGRVQWAEYIDGAANRIVSLSKQPCDFRGVGQWFIDASSANYPMAWSAGNTGDLFYDIAGTGAHGFAQLQPGEIYYVNFRNLAYDGVTPTCRTTTCNMVVHHTTPR